MSPTIRHKYKYFHSTVQRAKDRRQKFHFCRLPFDVRPRNVKLSLSNINSGNFLLKIRGAPCTWSMGWSMDRVHRAVHGSRSMFCTRPTRSVSLGSPRFKVHLFRLQDKIITIKVKNVYGSQSSKGSLVDHQGLFFSGFSLRKD